MLFSLLLLLLQFVHQFPLGSNTFRHLVVLHHGQDPLQEAISGLTKEAIAGWNSWISRLQIFPDLPSPAPWTLTSSFLLQTLAEDTNGKAKGPHLRFSEGRKARLEKASSIESLNSRLFSQQHLI